MAEGAWESEGRGTAFPTLLHETDELLSCVSRYHFVVYSYQQQNATENSYSIEAEK